MKHKLIIIIFTFILILTGCSKYNNNINDTVDINQLNIEPISKENAIKILQAEFGDFITASTEDIKSDDEHYIIDIYINLGYSEEELELQGDIDEHSHEEFLGTFKINMFTGDLIDEQKID